MEVPTNGPSTSQSAPPRFKRVPVTSCDSCRLRKLKCNAKELPPGSTCSSCAKHDWDCTFEDSKESFNRPSTRMRHKIHRNPNPPQPGIYPRNFHGETPLTGQHRKGDFNGLHFGQVSEQSARVDKNSNAQDISRLAQQLWPHVHVQAYAPSYGWSSGSAAVLPQSQNEFTPGGSRDPMSIDPGFNQAFHILPVISRLSLPPALTDPQTGLTQSIPPLQVAELLLLRFYTDPTSSASVVPRKRFFQRYQTCLPAPPPPYLISIMLALAAFLPTTKEPELITWRAHGWSQAVQAVQTRLRNGVPPCPAVIQSLLLLGTAWVGDPDDNERFHILDMALRLGVGMYLDARNAAEYSPEERSERKLLLWHLYITARIMLIATDRPLLVRKNEHDLPLPTEFDAETIALSARDGAPTQDDEHLWIHRLLLAFISLSEILEETKKVLHGLQTTVPKDVQEILQRIAPAESSMEMWCKKNKLLLRESAASHGPLCQNMTEAMVAQLHLCQLQLYQAPIRFQIQHAESLPVHFDASSSKSLTACVESAWYLIQQPLVNHDPAAAMQAILPGNKPITHFNMANLAVLRAAQFLRLLSCTWANWNSGRGLEEYTPRSAVEFAVAAQAPWGDVDPLQRLQPIPGRPQADNQFQYSIAPEWTGPQNNGIVPVPGFNLEQPVDPAPDLQGLLGASMPNADITLDSTGFIGGGSTAPDRSFGINTDIPSLYGSYIPFPSPLSAVIPTPMSAQGDLLFARPIADRMESSQSLGSSLNRQLFRRSAPTPLNLRRESTGSLDISAQKRKRGVNFSVTDGEVRVSKMSKFGDAADSGDSSKTASSDPAAVQAMPLTAPMLDMLPRMARLDAATLNSFAFPLTPARLLFDASEFGLDTWDATPPARPDHPALGLQGALSLLYRTPDSAAPPQMQDHDRGASPVSTGGNHESESFSQGLGMPTVAIPTTGTASLAPGGGGGGGSSSSSQISDSFLPPPPFAPSLGNFGATAAMMTPLRFNFQAVLSPADTVPSPTSALALANDLDLSALGLKGLDRLDSLHEMFTDLVAFDFASMVASGNPCPEPSAVAAAATANILSEAGATQVEERSWFGGEDSGPSSAQGPL